MKIVQINTVYAKGSTGKIAGEIQEESIKRGHPNIVAYRYAEGENVPNTFCISTWIDCHIHNRISRYTHRSGFYSSYRTARFIRYLERIHPDIAHIHNLHGSYINIVKLFDYLRMNRIKTVWTFHDCWPFTGYCPYFEIAHCEQWHSNCENCCYETNIFNKCNAKKSLQAKKEMVNDVDLTVVVPSKWMESLVQDSFYSKFDVRVIPNGIDLSVFKPTQSDFRTKYGIGNRNIVLGVAFGWGERKGLDIFIELVKRLDQEEYQIILVGTDDTVDKQLPDNIISIHRTNNQSELAEIYTAADVFVNPTREEVLGMVNIEANACGTPVVTFNTGGSPECIDNTSGSVVEKDDIDAMESEIIRICDTKPYSSKACVERAKKFDKNARFQEYIDLYEELCQ